MAYQVSNLSLYQERRKVIDLIMAKLDSERTETGLLPDVSAVVYGDRTDAANIDEQPTIWIIPAAHAINPTSGGVAIHDFTFDFVSMLMDYDSAQGKDRVEEVSSRVYDALMKNRSRNDEVFDILPLIYNPASEAVQNSNIYFASVQLAFRIQRRE
jgi:hypothetical protein